MLSAHKHLQLTNETLGYRLSAPTTFRFTRLWPGLPRQPDTWFSGYSRLKR